MPIRPIQRQVAAAAAVEASPQAQEILEQLERILRSQVFRNSQRYSAFLKYCVERCLEGLGDSLKERTIGVSVFGRAADYDTASDHVVRSAAAEIRKRLAQYYQELGAATEIRIEMVAGSYIPKFRFPASNSISNPAENERPDATDGGGGSAKAWRRSWPAVLAISAVGVLGIAGLATKYQRSPSAIDQFWGPILSSRGPVLLCIGERVEPDTARQLARTTTVGDVQAANSNRVSFTVATVVAKLTGLLQSREKPYRLLLRSATKFSDLQDGPSVLIGGNNNTWTMRLTDTLRFGFDGQSKRTFRIRDKENPGRKDWSVDFSLPVQELNRDYAIVSRVFDPTTERTSVIVAGVAHWGTLAAGEFISEPSQLRKLQARAPAGWEQMNLQVVLSTDVIDGIPGPPKIVATHFW